MRLFLFCLLVGCTAARPAMPPAVELRPTGQPVEPVQTAPSARVRARDFETDLSYSCLRTDDNRIACWGFQLEQPKLPAWVEGLPPSDQLHVGGDFACARGVEDHVLRCWGLDHLGQLGRGHAERGQERPSFHAPEPVVVAGAPLVVEDFLVGSSHACAMARGGEVLCWGGSVSGEAGAAPKQDKVGWLAQPTPRVVYRGATRVYGGADTSCAVDAKEQLFCWGGQDAGYSGHGDTWKPRLTKTPGPVRAMSLGSGHSCLLDAVGQIHCRGWNPGGQLGSAGHVQAPSDGKGARHSDFRPDFARVPELAGRYVSVAASRHETCGVTEAGTLECVGTGTWAGAETFGPGPREGSEAKGNAAQSSSSSSSAPVGGVVIPVAAVPGFRNLVSVRSTMGRRCALDREGDVYCVGSLQGFSRRDAAVVTPSLVTLPP